MPALSSLCQDSQNLEDTEDSSPAALRHLIFKAGASKHLAAAANPANLFASMYGSADQKGFTDMIARDGQAIVSDLAMSEASNAAIRAVWAAGAMFSITTGFEHTSQLCTISNLSDKGLM